MRLFLIRHGETVDNVAQVYAGVKDSALTVHGSLQAERLGKFLAAKTLNITRIFSSDLQRAYRTANTIRFWNEEAQPGRKLEVTALKVLREQDFGFYEGKPFYERSKDSTKSGKDTHRSQLQADPDFKDVETKDSMTLRMADFLQEHLVPAMKSACRGKDDAVVIVSHGIILTHLWRCFLKLLPKSSVTFSPGLSVGNGGVIPLEFLGGWSNTGYLELDMQQQIPTSTSHRASSPSRSHSPEPITDTQALLHGYQVRIIAVNGKEHLQGLKRTKGVGSSRFDEGQKSIESFFKKRKVASGQD